MQELVKEYRDWRKAEGLPWNPNFVPKSYDGLPDLEHKYWQAERKAQDYERERAVTKAIEVKKALPAARPRRKPLIRKGTKPGTVIIRESGEFGGPEFKLLMDGVGEAFEMFTKDVIEPMQKRIAELEARPVGLKYMGTFKPNYSYAKDMGVTHQGSVWVALKDKPTKEPGEPNSNWQLAVKKGRDAK